MEYLVKNSLFLHILKVKDETCNLESEKAYREFMAKNVKTDDDLIIMIFSGYLDAMEDGAEVAHVKLDMTYETIGNVIPATIALANLQHKNDYDDRRNAVVTMKTLAAYLTMMMINNHNADIKVEKKANKHNKSIPELWSDTFYLRINNKRDSDLLAHAIKGIDAVPITVESGFVADLTFLMNEYKRITGINLMDYGFSNLIINFTE